MKADSRLSWLLAAICLPISLSKARNLRSLGVTGVVDGISNFMITGWACQEGNPQSINIHVYTGGPAGEGSFLKDSIANLGSDDTVAAACATAGTNYRFEVPITEEEVKKHGGDSIYVHGISTTGIGNNLLFRSGEFEIPQQTPFRSTQSPVSVEVALPTSPAPSPPGEEAIRINAGGMANYTDTEGRIWKADQYLDRDQGSVYSMCPFDIAGTVNDDLYCSERFFHGHVDQTSFQYDIPVPRPGRYIVHLHFAEIYYRNPGSRVFHILVNGVLEYSNLDIVDLVGYLTALVVSVEIQATDSVLIEFVAVIEFPKISAMEVIALGSAGQSSPGYHPTSPPMSEISDTPSPSPSKAPSFSPTHSPTPRPSSTLLPTSRQDLFIKKGETFTLDSSINVGLIKVEGKLVCSDNTATLEIDTEGIVVVGQNAEFRCGTPSAPFRGSLTIKLKGDRDASQVHESSQLGPRAIVAIDSGVINMHGESGKEGFQYLQATAKPNDKQIRVEDASRWAKGDSIVIAPTNINPYEAEERYIVDISSDGKLITLDAPLVYEHWGSIQQYQNGKGQTWDLDERAEVFNLNRNIRIMPGDTSLGGHVIVRGSESAAYVDNVEFYRMGQTGLMGRYPFHWHRKGDVDGQYIKNSSIHKSFQRCIVVHQTNYATVEGNTCYDHFGHGYFLEDGNEVKNRIVNNLGVLSKKPASQNTLLASDIGDGQNMNRFPSPSTFWISHPDNFVKGNVAVASEGTGFWMAFVSNTLPHVNPPATPISSNTWVFEDNIAHSCKVGITWDGAPNGSEPTRNKLNPDDRAITSAHYQPSQVPTFNKLVVYKCSEAGMYFRGSRAIYKNAIMADNKLSAFFAYDQELVDSLIVGVSKNRPPNDGQKRIFCGVPVYDGPFFLDNVHFAGFSNLPARATAFPIDLLFGGFEVFTNQVRRLTFDDPSSEKIRLDYQNSNWADSYGASVRDIDGSLTGRADSLVVPNHPLTNDSRCSAGNGVDGSTLICDYELGYLRLWDLTSNNGLSLDFTITREDELTGEIVSFHAKKPHNNKFPIILGDDYQYVVSDLKFRDGEQRYMLWFYTMDIGVKSPMIVFREVPDSCRIKYADGKDLEGGWSLSTLASAHEHSNSHPKYSLFVELESKDAPALNRRSDSFRGLTKFEIAC